MSFFNFNLFNSRNKLKKTLVNNGSPNSNNSSPENVPLYLNPSKIQLTLVKGDFQKVVDLPKYVELNEWIACNVFDFVTNINLILSVISEYCTVETCPRMTANNTIYNYLDNQQKVQKLPACQFIDYTLTNIQNLIDNEQIFPTKQGTAFSQNFTQLTREICLNLFKIFAHLLTTHYDQFHQLQFLPYFNSIFYHFLSFVKKFNLIDKRELIVCEDLIKELEVNELIC